MISSCLCSLFDFEWLLRNQDFSLPIRRHWHFYSPPFVERQIPKHTMLPRSYDR